MNKKEPTRKSTMISTPLHVLLKESAYGAKMDMVNLHEKILGTVLTDERLLRKVLSAK